MMMMMIVMRRRRRERRLLSKRGMKDIKKKKYENDHARVAGRTPNREKCTSILSVRYSLYT